MVNKFTAFRGMFNGDSWADAFIDARNDPTRRERNKAATRIAEGEAAFQPMAQGLQVLGAGQRSQEIGLGGQRLGLDREKFGYQQVADRESLEDKQAGRVHEKNMVLDRSLGSHSAYSLVAAREGQAPQEALTLGSRMRVKQAGAESGARSGAAAAVDTRKRLSWAQMSEVARRVQAAKAAGQTLDFRQATRDVAAEFGNTPPQAPGRGLRTDEQRAADASQRTLERLISNATANDRDPLEALTTFLGSPEAAEQALQSIRQRMGAGMQPGAGTPEDDEEATNLQEIFDAGVAKYGPDPSKWPAEFTSVPAAAEAIRRYKESMGQ
jgi:hypothetical protein